MSLVGLVIDNIIMHLVKAHLDDSVFLSANFDGGAPCLRFSFVSRVVVASHQDQKAYIKFKVKG